MEIKYKCTNIGLVPVGVRGQDGKVTVDPSGKELVVAQFAVVDMDGKAIAGFQPQTKRYEKGQYEIGGIYDKLADPTVAPVAPRVRPGKK